MLQPQLPPDLEAALASHGLTAAFAKYPPSHRAEFLNWIDEAKREETRTSRIAKTIEALRAKGPAAS